MGWAQFEAPAARAGGLSHHSGLRGGSAAVGVGDTASAKPLAECPPPSAGHSRVPAAPSMFMRQALSRAHPVAWITVGTYLYFLQHHFIPILESG